MWAETVIWIKEFNRNQDKHTDNKKFQVSMWLSACRSWYLLSSGRLPRRAPRWWNPAHPVEPAWASFLSEWEACMNLAPKHYIKSSTSAVSQCEHRHQEEHRRQDRAHPLQVSVGLLCRFSRFYAFIYQQAEALTPVLNLSMWLVYLCLQQTDHLRI